MLLVKIDYGEAVLESRYSVILTAMRVLWVG